MFQESGFKNRCGLNLLHCINRQCTQTELLMNLMINEKVIESLKDAELKTGRSKEELLQLCLSSHLLEKLGSSGLSTFLSSNNFVEVLPDTVLD